MITDSDGNAHDPDYGSTIVAKTVRAGSHVPSRDTYNNPTTKRPLTKTFLCLDICRDQIIGWGNAKTTRSEVASRTLEAIKFEFAGLQPASQIV